MNSESLHPILCVAVVWIYDEPMNAELAQLADGLGISRDEHRRFRLAFGLSCALRVKHSLEDQRALDALIACQQYLDGQIGEAAFAVVAKDMLEVANSHGGSRSLDGAAHAAVSATYAVAQAVNGRALEAAAYAAYASVYAYAGHAVTDPDAFAGEHAWQVARFRELRELREQPVPSA